MKKSICVIFTGCTIGSDTKGNSISLSRESRKLLIEKYREQTGSDINFDMLTPINILSENVQPDDLEKLYNCVKGVDISLYDGIIITHGTDTLCFTVNLFSQLFCRCPVPVVFVSALYPLTDSRSNGLKNFAGAVDFIKKAKIGGVYCAFANDGENCKIHLASRLIYPDEINGFYHSAMDAHFAEIEDGEIKYNSSPLLPTPDEIKKSKAQPVEFALCDKIMLITMRSLLNFEVYDFSKVKPQAVIIELSHSGTVCTEGDVLNFKNFARYCEACGVSLVLGPIMRWAGVYASMSDLPRNVIISDTTIEMTIVKVMTALGANLPANAYFDRDTAFEKIPFPQK